MPIVMVAPVINDTDEILRTFTDSVGTSPVTYTYRVKQEKITVTNKGTSHLILTVGVMMYTIPPNRSQTVATPFTEFIIYSTNGTQSFEAISDEVEYNTDSTQQEQEIFTKIKANANKIGNLSAIAINVKSSPYNCKGDGTTDDTTGLQNAINATAVNGELIIPPGTYLHSGITFSTQIKVICYGQLKYTGTGSGVKISCNDSIFDGINVIRTYSTSSNVAALLAVGIELSNARNIILKNPRVEGFASGIKFNGNNVPVGFIYIYSPIIGQCKISYDVTTSGSGWANEVDVFGGRFTLGGFSDHVGSRYVSIPTQESHRFFGTSFEGGTNIPERKLYNGGSYNEFVSCRWEGSNGGTDVEFLNGSSQNGIIYGRFIEGNTVVDNGSFNDVIGHLVKKSVGINHYSYKKQTNISSTYVGNEPYIFCDCSAGNVIVELSSVGTASANKGRMYVIKKTDTSDYKVFIYPASGDLIDGQGQYQINTTGGCISIMSDGTQWRIVNNVNEYYLPVESAPTTGTWGVGDKVYIETPTAGGYIGYVCVTAGTPGVWKGFGAIQA